MPFHAFRAGPEKQQKRFERLALSRLPLLLYRAANDTSFWPF